MAAPAIEALGVRKDFRSRGRKVSAVDGLDLAVPVGTVHGFLGPNGSGKTTTIRMLLGLARPSGGQMSIFGESVPDQLPAVMPRVGAIVEQPRFTPSFTARRNLLLLAGMVGAGRAEVKRALEQVGLGDRARERVSSYSFGMRQRLAIASTLLKSPELLILDEPTVGLDPEGISQVREVLRALGENGVTILMSSNNLAEVQQVCHSVTIVSAGRTVAAGRVEDLLGEDRSQTRIEVAATAPAIRTLEGAGFTVHPDPESTRRLLVEGHDHPEDISRVLGEAGIWLHELSAVRPDLETVFLALTRDATRPPEAGR